MGLKDDDEVEYQEKQKGTQQLRNYVINWQIFDCLRLPITKFSFLTSNHSSKNSKDSALLGFLFQKRKIKKKLYTYLINIYKLW